MMGFSSSGTMFHGGAVIEFLTVNMDAGKVALEFLFSPWRLNKLIMERQDINGWLDISASCKSYGEEHNG